MNYHYANENSQTVGPCTAEQMRQLHQMGTLRNDSWVIEEGATEWKTYAALFPPPIQAECPPAHPKFCPSCGAQNAEQARFCAGCGAQLVQLNAPAPGSSVGASPAPSEVKQRHWCLTAYLGILVIANSITAVIYLFGSGYIRDNVPSMPRWALPFFAIGGIMNVVCSIALFRWKKWGFFGLVGMAVLATLINLKIGVDTNHVLMGLLGVVILYGALQMGQKKTGWEQLDAGSQRGGSHMSDPSGVNKQFDQTYSASASSRVPQLPASASLSCPQCSKTDVRPPAGWWPFGMAFGALILLSIVNKNDNVFFDAGTVICLGAVIQTFYNAVTRKNKCRSCGFRWKGNA